MPMEPCNEKLLAVLAPNLVYLNVIVTPRYPSGTSSPVPRAYFGGEDPAALRALALSLKAGVNPIDNFVSLAHIRLCGTDTEYRARAFLRLLANTPVLETLYLVDAPLVLGYDWARPDPIPTVQLNHLRALSFDNPGFEAAFAVLEHLKFPPDAVVELHRLQYTPHTNLDAMLVPSLTKFTILEVMEKFPALHIRGCGASGGLWVHITAERPDVGMLTFRAIVPFVLEKFANNLDMVQTLRMGGCMSAFSSNPSLLEIAMPKVSKLMPMLSNLFVATDYNPAAHLVPSLKWALLSIEALSDVRCPALDTLGILGNLPTAMDKHLLELLSQRARRGHRIRTLYIRSSCEEENSAVLDSSSLADHVEKIDTRRVTWNPEGTRRQMLDLWGLPEVWRG